GEPRPSATGWASAWGSCSRGAGCGVGPDLHERDDGGARETHVLDADPLPLAVRVVAAGKDVRRRQAHLGERRAVGAAPDRRLLRLEADAAYRLLEVRDDLGVLPQRVAHVAVLDERLDLDRAALVGRRHLRRDRAQQLDVLVEHVVLEVADNEAQLHLRGVAGDHDRMQEAFALIGRLGREPVLGSFLITSAAELIALTRPAFRPARWSTRPLPCIRTSAPRDG